MLGVCMSTVNRRLKDFEMSISQTYSAITDEALDRTVQEIIDFPSCGYRCMVGYLKAREFHVQQLRIRESVRRSDPEYNRAGELIDRFRKGDATSKTT